MRVKCHGVGGWGPFSEMYPPTGVLCELLPFMTFNLEVLHEIRLILAAQSPPL